MKRVILIGMQVKKPQKTNFLLNKLRERHHRHYRDSYFHLWADLLLGGLLVALLYIIIATVFWQPHAAFSLETRAVSSSISSGQSEEFITTYRSEEEEAIKGVEIKVNLPENFLFLRAEPTDLFDAETASFHLDTLPPKAKGEVKIIGRPLGEIGERQSLNFIATYLKEGSQRKLLDSFHYTLDNSALQSEIIIPERAYVNSNFKGSLEIKNTSAVALENISIVFPDKSLSLQFSERASSNNQLEIPALQSGEVQKIDFTAKSESEGNFNMTAEVFLRINGQLRKQTSVTKQVAVDKSSLQFHSQLSSLALQPQLTTTELTLDFSNTETESLEEVGLTLTTNRSDIFVKNITTTSEYVVRGSSLLIGNLASNQHNNLKLIIELERKNIALHDTVDLNLLTSYTFQGQKYEYTTFLGNLKFNSNLTLASGGYYYGSQGDQLGIGPIPPQVDIPTTYWIIWQGNNLGNEIKNFKVTADLPEGVVWTEQQSLTSGTLNYSPISRRIIWETESMAAAGGNYRASFAVSVVPNSKDIGQSLKLLGNIRFQGLDSFTGRELGSLQADITTEIEGDKLSGGKGKVVPN